MAEPLQGTNSTSEESVPFTASDPRIAPRFTLLIRTAKLINSHGEFLSILRDASATGVSVRTFHKLAPERHMLLEMPNGDRHEIETVWEREGAAGFRFTHPIDAQRIIEGRGRFSRRPVRLRLQVPAVLTSSGRSFAAVVRNISQQGARIDCRELLALEQKLQLDADGLPPIRAKVRWRRGEEYGLVFDDTFQFAELAQLANELQLRGGADPLVPPEERVKTCV